MIVLNDIQADRICEIVDVRFDHYSEAQYRDEPHNDTEPQYYFWPAPITKSAFKNRITGEYCEDELIEKLIFMFDMDQLIKIKDSMDTIEQKEKIQLNIDAQQKLLAKKKSVLDYLISEGLIEK